ncbi:M28 family peptidase [Nocardioides sp. zg-1228]|uniref:M28 family peptidase n=1 Tax=Nocardioides sp. zg-1228 TaxID=2763008 RepID=UPI0016429B71|nr:M28 family peptidase [Nocardioides sp. zg-1228]MBC2933902.1 M28 family peptidase [Nocardioides sp. zg-1228]QSF58668.1 M28 family peptidase [Nocardioides sp. zg-1228]
MRSTTFRATTRARRATAGLGAAALAVAGLVAGTQSVAQGDTPAQDATPVAAAAATPPTYERDLTEQLDGSRAYATVKHLVEQIGPRVNGTPAERRGAAYLRDVLEPYGYEVELQSWGPVSTKRTADVVTAGAPLPGGPKWQMAASPSGVYTGDGAPVTAPVVPVGTGQTAEDYADASGAIAYAVVSTPAERGTAMTLAAANGAVAVILAPPVPASGKTAPRNPTVPAGTAAVAIPVLGAGSDHTVWLDQALQAGPVSLRLVTNEYVNPMGTNIIATRHAVGDPQGTTAPIVMVGAHIDSVLGAPGGHDDASGNGVSTEIARVLATLPYDKEIRIGGFGGEEGGLLGARAYVDTLTPATRKRFVGEWQMDMVGTTHEPARLWALTPDGRSNYVVEQAYAAAARDGFGGLDNCKLGQSDHQAFFDAGIPAALFIWLDYQDPVAPSTCESIARGSYRTEPEYHQPSDGMNNVSEPRLQITLDVIGGAVIENALNALTVTAVTKDGAPLSGAQVLVDCGDGSHDAGRTDEAGVTRTRVPSGRCALSATKGSDTVTGEVAMSGDESVRLTLDGGTAPALPRISASAETSRYGQSPVVRIDLAPAALEPTGSIEIRDGGRVLATTSGQPGVRSVILPAARLRPGRHDVDVVYVDASGADRVVSPTRVKVLKARAQLRLRPVRTVRGARVHLPVRLVVRPRDIAFAARGRIVVRSGGREVGSARLRDGRVVVRLDRLDRSGKHVLRVRHVGNRLVRPSSASTTVVVGKG